MIPHLHHFNMSENITYSDYWLDDIDEFNQYDDSPRTVDLDLIRLASARRAISNFVQILTNKSIPVFFNNKDANLTDGKNVYLSADIVKKDDFDPAVGLALHEGSHILFSDFDLLKTMWMKIPREIYDITESKNISKETVIDTVKFVWNIIEDRYIDNFIYQNAPGYRGYYISLYNKYFRNSKIDDMLKSKMYRETSIDAYIYRICNFTNSNTDLNALPDLRVIAQLIDIKNIGRLTKPIKRFELSFDVCKIIFDNVGTDDNKVSKSSGQLSDDVKPAQSPEKTDNPIESKTDNPTESKTDNPIESDDSSQDDDVDDVLGGTETSVPKTNDQIKHSIEHNEGDTSELSDNKIRQIKKALEKQKGFMDGSMKKKMVSSYQNTLLESIEKSGMSIEKVGQDYITCSGKHITSGIDCIVVKNLTKDLIDTEDFPMSGNTSKTRGPRQDMIDAVNRGITMGNKLGNKLLLRNENNTTKYMRKSDGKIDKRIISELGFDNDRVFCTYKAEKYNDAFIHISVDASSSMSGQKWYQTITTVTAICKACSLIENVKVSVSFRTTIYAKRNNSIPYVILAYDSTKDKFSKIKNLFPYLTPNGTTPEGLAYEATMNIFSDKNKENNCYFLNFSDGEPMMSFDYNGDIHYYIGDSAAIHTKRQVEKIKEKGYQILSYFINESYYRNSNFDSSIKSYKLFKMMYGIDATFINTNNINDVAKSINQMFLKKDEISG